MSYKLRERCSPTFPKVLGHLTEAQDRRPKPGSLVATGKIDGGPADTPFPPTYFTFHEKGQKGSDRNSLGKVNTFSLIGG